MKRNRSYIGNMMIASDAPVIVYGSVRGLVSEHRLVAAAEKALKRDQSGCKSQGGYSDASIYQWSDGGWELAGTED